MNTNIIDRISVEFDEYEFIEVYDTFYFIDLLNTYFKEKHSEVFQYISNGFLNLLDHCQSSSKIYPPDPNGLKATRMRAEYLFVRYVHSVKGIDSYPKAKKSGKSYKRWSTIAGALNFKKKN